MVFAPNERGIAPDDAPAAISVPFTRTDDVEAAAVGVTVTVSVVSGTVAEYSATDEAKTGDRVPALSRSASRSIADARRTVTV